MPSLVSCGEKATSLLDTPRNPRRSRSSGTFLRAALLLAFLLGFSRYSTAQLTCPQPGTWWKFLGDLSYWDGTEVDSGETIYKGWKLKNCGTTDWSGFKAVRIAGIYGPTEIPLPDAKSLEEFEIWVWITVPTMPGLHKAEYKIRMPNGVLMDESFWVEIRVVSGQTFTLTVTKTGSGTVRSSPSGIDCGGTCSAGFGSGTTVMLSAEPAGGFVFAGWSGDSDCSDGVVNMNGNHTCHATFESSPTDQYTLSVQKSGTGTGRVTGPGIDCGGDCWENYPEGTSVILAAAPDPGSTFAGWSGDCSSSGQVIMDTNKQCTAEFTTTAASPSLNMNVSPTSLSVNVEGWPEGNPVEIRLTAQCPGPGSCTGNLNLSVGSASNQGRFYVIEAGVGSDCISGEEPLSRTSYDINCPVMVGSGQSSVHTWKLWIQPSSETDLLVSANWLGDSESDSVSIPQANIHPLLFIHGIMGCMPPQELFIDTRGKARDNLDPFLGHYWPILDTLVKMGYEWNKTLFAMCYDWLESNEVSADFLRDSLAQDVIPRASFVNYVNRSDPRADLVVHSMGGLVSRSYIQGPDWAGNVRKVVFVASPHKGFPFDYRTWEGGTWVDYVYNAPILSGSGIGFQLLVDRVLWPTLVAKRYRPSTLDLAICTFKAALELRYFDLFDFDGVVLYTKDPVEGLFLCDRGSVASWAHSGDPARGVRSLPEMLPTEDMPPYLRLPLVGTAFPYGHERNDFLEDLNANISLLSNRIGVDNIYVLAGTGAPQTDFDYRVAPPPLFSAMWNYGEVVDLPIVPDSINEEPWGDDLIPLPSATLDFSGLLSLPDFHEIVLDAAPNPGGARHSPIMHHESTQTIWIPWFLSDMTIPFKTDYRAPLLISIGDDGIDLPEIREFISVTGACPVDFLITDPLGRRLGYDPASGQVVGEIPYGIYTRPGAEPQVILIANPEPGEYTVTAKGWSTIPGSPGFSLRADRIGGAISPQAAFGGTTNPNQQHTFFFDLPPNNPPVAEAGSNQTVPAGDGCMSQVTLDGTGSSDPDGDPLTYTWTGSFGTAEGPTAEVSLPLGTHTISLTVHDGKGQTSTDAVIINVVDTTAPEISPPDPVTVEQTNLDGTQVELPEPTVTDNCTVAEVASDAPAVFPLGTTTVTFTATDASGNTATATTTVTVEDTTPPTINNIPAPVTVEQASLDGTEVELPMPTVTDICDAEPEVTTDAPTVFPLGSTTVTFTATDASGNVARATTTVTVQDTMPPVMINVPDPVTVEQTSLDGTPVRLSMPTATDICDVDPEVTSDAPAVFPLGTTTVTFIARDDSGNTTTAKTTVTVVDTTPPHIRSVQGNPSQLWPPNHKMVPVRVSVSVRDLCDAKPFCKIISVTSNEPVGGRGGDRAPDWSITGNLTVNLRAERSGNRSGRVYTIKVRCNDDSGNSSYRTGTVIVPHDQGKKPKDNKGDKKDNRPDDRGKKNGKKK